MALCLVLPLLVLPWRLFATGSPHIAGKTDKGFIDNGWTLGSAMRHHAFWALFCTFFFTAVAMYAITAQIVAYLIDAGFPPLQAATAWGFSGILTLFGMLGISALDGIIGRRPSVLFSYGVSIVGIILLWLLQYYPNYWLLTGFIVCFGSMIGSRGPLITATALNIFRGEAGRHHFRHDLDRQRARLGTGLLDRRPDPRLDPELQLADRVRAGQCGAGTDPVPGGAGAAALINCSAETRPACSPCRCRTRKSSEARRAPSPKSD